MLQEKARNHPGLQAAVDRQGQDPRYKEWKEKRDSAWENSKTAACHATPWITKLGFDMLTCSPAKGNDTLGILVLLEIFAKALGLPVLIGGLVIDTIKAPFALVVMGEEAVRAGVCGLASTVIGPKPSDAPQIEALYASFLLRFREAISLAVYIDEETQEGLEKKFAEDSQMDMITIAFLLTAWHSRTQPDHRLLLATGKYLNHEDCPEELRPFLQVVVTCREEIRKSFPHNLNQPLTSQHVKQFLDRWFIPIRRAIAHNTPLELSWARSDTSGGGGVVRALNDDDDADVKREQQSIKQTLKALQGLLREAKRREVAFLKQQGISYSTSVTAEQVLQFRDRMMAATLSTTEEEETVTTASRAPPPSSGDESPIIVSTTSPETENIRIWKEKQRERRAAMAQRRYRNTGNVPEEYIDPVTKEMMVVPVLANDGIYYDHFTAWYMKEHNQRGCRGIVITQYHEDPVLREEIEMHI